MDRETTKGDNLFGDNEEAIKNLSDIPTPNIVAYKQYLAESPEGFELRSNQMAIVSSIYES